MNICLNKNVVVKDFNKKGLVIDVERARCQKLNTTGLYIVKLLESDGACSEEKIIEKVSQFYDIPERLIQDDIKTFLKGLLDKNFLNDVENPSGAEIIEEQGKDGNGIWIQVTNGCNIRCKYCYADAGCSQDDLTIAEIETILSELKDMNYSKIVVTGGEPLLRKDIIDILKVCKKYGKVQLLTNGIREDEELYQEIMEIVEMVQISIDSYDAEIHDANRGKGSYEKTLKTIKLLSSINPAKVTLAMTPTPEYMADLVEMMKFCLSMDIRSLHINRFVPFGRAKEYEKEINLKEFFQWVNKGYDYLYALYDNALKEKKDFYFNLDVASDLRKSVFSTVRKCSCGLNENLISVGYNGDVYLCPSLHTKEFKLGSIRENSIVDIIQQSKEKLGSFRVENLPKCKNCEIKYYCGGGCRALAYNMCNDIYGKEANCNDYIDRVYELMLR